MHFIVWVDEYASNSKVWGVLFRAATIQSIIWALGCEVVLGRKKIEQKYMKKFRC